MSEYNDKKQYYMAVIREINGEQEYNHDIIIEAADDTEALIKTENIARDWYDCSDYEQEEDWIAFDIGIAVKVEYVKEITPVEFFKRHIMVKET